MEIENMHPFCLPFSLCHDATSSSITDDNFGARGKQLASGVAGEMGDNRDDKLKLADSSPMDDESFDRLSCSELDHRHRLVASPIDGRSHDAFDLLELEMEMRLGEANDSDEFKLIDEENCENVDKSDDWFSLTNSNHDQCLLFSSSNSANSSLRSSSSPLKSASSSSSSYLKRDSQQSTYSTPPTTFTLANHHQVFQHIVDPIDIKSSPTLAQLNLNSTDDPTDGLWDSTTSATSGPRSSTQTTTPLSSSTLISSSLHHHHLHHHHHHHHLSPAANLTGSPITTTDLLTSTSTQNISSTGAASPNVTGCSNANLLSACNHLNQFNTDQHNGNSNLTPEATHFASHLNNNSHSHSCQHHHLQQQQQQHQHHHHLQRLQANEHQQLQLNAHGGCLMLSSFQKTQRIAGPIVDQIQGQSCCLNHSHHYQHLERFNANMSPVCPEHKGPLGSPRFQMPQYQHQCGANATHASDQLQYQAKKQQQQLLQLATSSMQAKSHGQLQQQRCQSPAPLVTSSSSPLSSSSALQPGAGLTSTAGDNKLKENIEYLSVLLCNGSKKLDGKTNQNQQQQQLAPSQPSQQQPTISSTMVRSYSTLAQTLSTGPKLFERYHQQGELQVNAQLAHSLNHSQQTQTTGAGEVAMQMDSQLDDASKRLCQSNCFKQTSVESSISAADSTAENQSSRAAGQPFGSSCYASQMDSNHATGHVSRSNDMKVLSSLLNSNKDNFQPQAACWPSARPCNLNLSQANGQMLNSLNNNNSSGLYPTDTHLGANVYGRQESSPIPINGRPITLTPLVSNNVNIAQRPNGQQQQQQQQQQMNQKSRAPTFVQPASPSTSSTTSSSGNTDSAQTTAQSVQLATVAKKQQNKSSANQLAKRSTNQTERSGRPSSMSTDCSLSSHDEGFSSQIDQDDCNQSTRADSDDDDSDIDSDDESFYGDYTNNDLIGASISDNPDCKWTLNMGRTRRNGQRRFFWQYNVQSKGPKGTRVCSTEGAEDPFVLPEASDPVFSDECQIEGVKHSGKARRGDGNDLTPNPRKLLMIGLELKKLSKIINELAPVTELPINARNKTRKEKNKLASRACRLKKKAQHEANKIKLYGLQREHQQVVMAIFDARKMIHKSLTQQATMANNAPNDGNNLQLSTNLRQLLDQCIMTVAGQTGDYVNSVLEKVVSGCIDGGLQT